MHSTLILKQWRHSDQHVYSCAVWSCCLFQKHFWASSVISGQASMYMCSLVSVFCRRLFSVKQLTFEIYIILCQYSSHSFILGSQTKTKFNEINILNSNFLSSSYGNESHKSVCYGKYTTLNMVLFLLLIG